MKKQISLKILTPIVGIIVFLATFKGVLEFMKGVILDLFSISPPDNIAFNKYMYKNGTPWVVGAIVIALVVSCIAMYLIYKSNGIRYGGKIVSEITRKLNNTATSALNSPKTRPRIKVLVEGDDHSVDALYKLCGAKKTFEEKSLEFLLELEEYLRSNPENTDVERNAISLIRTSPLSQSFSSSKELFNFFVEYFKEKGQDITWYRLELRLAGDLVHLYRIKNNSKQPNETK